MSHLINDTHEVSEWLQTHVLIWMFDCLHVDDECFPVYSESQINSFFKLAACSLGLLGYVDPIYLDSDFRSDTSNQVGFVVRDKWGFLKRHGGWLRIVVLLHLGSRFSGRSGTDDETPSFDHIYYNTSLKQSIPSNCKSLNSQSLDLIETFTS